MAGHEAVSGDARAAIAEAIATFDGERVADALLDLIQGTLSPMMLAGFMTTPDKAVELRRFVVDPAWTSGVREDPDFTWMAPLLVDDVANGASLIGPPCCGASQIAAAMRVGGGRVGLCVVTGFYEDVEAARTWLADLVFEAGFSTQTLRRATERATDLAALRERERLSRDLHDSLSQSLWSLSMLSETAQSMIDPSDRLHELVSQIADISLSSQEEMRGLLIDLRTVEPSQETIAGVLESLVRDFRASHDLEIIASVAEADLDASEVMALRRIAEEALNNVGRHAGASRVSVLFDSIPVPTLRVSDDGKGFSGGPTEGHLGVRIMAERAEGVGYDFEVQSSPGNGTVITAALDATRARPAPKQPVQPAPPSMRHALWFLIGGILATALAVGMLAASRSDRMDAEQVRTELDILTVLQERVSAARASADELNALLLEGVGVADADDVAEAKEAREVALADAARRVDPLAAPGTVSGEYALQLLEALAAASALGSGDDRLQRLAAGAISLRGPSVQASVETATPLHSLGNLAMLEEVVAFGLLEALVARYAMDPGAFTPSDRVQQFLERSVEIVREDGGYLGPDPQVPLQGGYLSVDIALIHEREAVGQLNRIIADAGLWDDDEWIRGWTESIGPPPTTLDEYVQRSARASTEFRAVVDARFEGRQAQLRASHDGEQLAAQRLLLGAGLLGFGAVVALLWALATVMRRARAAAVDNSIDPLTGVGNRRQLESEVLPRLEDPLLQHHAMVTLDMDRFKFINDVHGHGFGDRLLEIVGAGLDAMTRYTSEIQGVAVRVGGDEFVATFHSADEIPVELVHQAFNRLRSTLVSAGDGTLVRCSFSYGVVIAEGSPDMRSMMTASDLAAYEDKSRIETARLNS